jgi:hypothetical protein
MIVLQAFIVAVIVTGSLAFSAWRLSSAKMKLRLLEFVAPRSTNRFVSRLRATALAQLTHGCHACAPTRTPAAPRR